MGEKSVAISFWQDGVWIGSIVDRIDFDASFEA